MSILLKIGGGSFAVEHLTGALASALPAAQHQTTPPDDWEGSGLPTGQRMHKPVAYDGLPTGQRMHKPLVDSGLPTGQRMHKPLIAASPNSGTLAMQRQVWQVSGLNAGRAIPQLTLVLTSPVGQVHGSVKLLNATIGAVRAE